MPSYSVLWEVESHPRGMANARPLVRSVTSLRKCWSGPGVQAGTEASLEALGFKAALEDVVSGVNFRPAEPSACCCCPWLLPV